MASPGDNQRQHRRDALGALALCWQRDPSDKAFDGILAALEPFLSQQAQRVAYALELEDAFQIARLAVLSALSTWKPEKASFWTWVHQKVHRQLRAEALRSKSRICVVAVGELPEQAAPIPTMDLALRIEIEKALATLPERQALVIRLHYIEQIDHVEIGRRMGLSHEGVGKIRRAGLVNLRKQLADIDTLF